MGVVHVQGKYFQGLFFVQDLLVLQGRFIIARVNTCKESPTGLGRMDADTFQVLSKVLSVSVIFLVTKNGTLQVSSDILRVW